MIRTGISNSTYHITSWLKYSIAFHAQKLESKVLQNFSLASDMLQGHVAHSQPHSLCLQYYTSMRGYIVLLGRPLLKSLIAFKRKSVPPMQIQTLDARYINSAALLALLKQLFGIGSFTIDVRISPNLQQPSFWLIPVG